MSVRPAPIDPETLLLAYRSGIFPMADSIHDDEVFWVEPRERAIMPLDGFRCSRSLAKTLKQQRFDIRCDSAFGHVMIQCAAPRADDSGSWISDRLRASYGELHRRGHAHSIECWQDGELVGGLYGVAFDRVFCGESMFSRRPNASKVAMAWLVAAMREAGYALLDCQFMTDHLASLGAVEIPQRTYVALVAEASGEPRCSLPEAVKRFQAASSPGKLIAQSLTQTS